jgi:hypothetical protein
MTTACLLVAVALGYATSVGAVPLPVGALGLLTLAFLANGKG